jgi:hypothetical protein
MIILNSNAVRQEEGKKKDFDEKRTKKMIFFCFLVQRFNSDRYTNDTRQREKKQDKKKEEVKKEENSTLTSQILCRNENRIKKLLSTSP